MIGWTLIVLAATSAIFALAVWVIAEYVALLRRQRARLLPLHVALMAGSYLGITATLSHDLATTLGSVYELMGASVSYGVGIMGLMTLALDQRARRK